MHGMQTSEIHQEVMEDIQTLMNEKGFRFNKALKLVLEQNRTLFEELIDSDESGSESESSDVTAMDR